jgi:hypothetical protein
LGVGVPLVELEVEVDDLVDVDVVEIDVDLVEVVFVVLDLVVLGLTVCVIFAEWLCTFVV